jgi:hypothetical protein
LHLAGRGGDAGLEDQGRVGRGLVAHAVRLALEGLDGRSADGGRDKAVVVDGVAKLHRDAGAQGGRDEKGAEFWKLLETEEFYPIEAAPQVDAPRVEIPDVKQRVITIESAEWAAAIERLRDAKEILTEAQALEKEAQAELIKLMEAAGAAAAEGAGARIYWIPQAGRRTFDVKAFAKKHPEIDLTPFYKISAETRPFKPYFLKGGSSYAE